MRDIESYATSIATLVRRNQFSRAASGVMAVSERNARRALILLRVERLITEVQAEKLKRFMERLRPSEEVEQGPIE